MTLDELQGAVDNARAHNHRGVLLVVPREPSGKSERMRIAPGLMGTCRAVNADGHSVVECAVDDVARLIQRARAT